MFQLPLASLFENTICRIFYSLHPEASDGKLRLCSFHFAFDEVRMYLVLFSAVFIKTLGVELVPCIDLSGTGQSVVSGRETEIGNYAILSEAPPAPLPPSFTICSSVRHSNSEPMFFQLYSSTGRAWLHLFLAPKSQDRLDALGAFLFGRGVFPLPGIEVQVVPGAWHHACLSLNTTSGEAQVVVNGQTSELQLGEMERSRPKRLVERLVLGKGLAVVWRQSTGRVAGVDIFQDLLPVNALVERTAGDVCMESGDYLSWKEMAWRLHGAATLDSVAIEDVCRKPRDTVLFTALFMAADECHRTCLKMAPEDGRMPPVVTAEQQENFAELVDQVSFDSGARRAGLAEAGQWLAVTDDPDLHPAAREGSFVDYITGARVGIAALTDWCLRWPHPRGLLWALLVSLEG